MAIKTYTYPLTRPQTYKGYIIKNVNAQSGVGRVTFTVERLRKKHVDRAMLGMLKTLLQKYTPIDTGRMSRGWIVDGFKSSTLFYTATVANRVQYGVFPYAHYKRLKRNFVYFAVRKWIDTFK